MIILIRRKFLGIKYVNVKVPMRWIMNLLLLVLVLLLLLDPLPLVCSRNNHTNQQ